MKPLIGILGGMGPLATVDLMQKIVIDTPAARDQDHVPVAAWNVPQVPDRQKALKAPARALVGRGVQRLVLACTEVPPAFEQIGTDLLPIRIDPTRALARACIDYWLQARQADSSFPDASRSAALRKAHGLLFRAFSTFFYLTAASAAEPTLEEAAGSACRIRWLMA